MPWDQAVWLAVGVVALGFTSVALLGLRDNIVALFVADAAAVFIWVVWAIQAFAVNRTTEAGVVITNNYPSLGYLALGFAVLMVLDLFVSVFEAMAVEFMEASDNG